MKKFYKNIKYEQYYDSNGYGKVEVIGRANRKLKVRFLDTGNEAWKLSYKVVSGDFIDSDELKRKSNSWTDCNKLLISNSGLEFLAFKEKGRKFKIKFSGTGYTTEVFKDNALNGKVRDPYSITFLGSGYLGEFNKSLRYWKQAKLLWSNMMKRCYDKKLVGNYVGEVTVSDRWKCFSNFLDDISSLENFDKWLSGQGGGGVKYNLDKDKILNGNKVYAKDVCMFLTEFENKSMGKLGKTLKSSGEFS